MPAMQLVLLLCEGVNEAEALRPLQRPSSHPIHLVRFARQGPKAAGSLIRTPSGQILPRRAAEIRRLARWGSLLPDEEQRMIGMTPLGIEFCPLLIVGFLLVGDLDHDKYVRAAQRSPYSVTLSRAFQRLHPPIGKVLGGSVCPGRNR